MCPDDPFDNSVSDLVVDHPVVGTTDEELVLVERREKKGAKEERGNLKREETQIIPKQLLTLKGIHFLFITWHHCRCTSM